MSGLTTVDELGTDITAQIKSSQLSIRGFKGEILTLDGKEVVDIILQTGAVVQKVIGINNEAITMDGIPVVNTIH